MMNQNTPRLKYSNNGSHDIHDSNSLIFRSWQTVRLVEARVPIQVQLAPSKQPRERIQLKR